MTIKRRLVISNILMIVIPVAIALVIALGGITITWSLVKQENDNHQAYITHREIVDLVIKTLEADEGSSELESALAVSHANIVVYDDAGNQHEFGSEVIRYQDVLLNTVRTVGGEGFVSIGNEEVYGEKRTSKGINYTVCMLNGMTDYNYAIFDTRITVVIIITVISIILAIIIANRFLTRFVFRKIEQSLNVLADGVHEISAGNLDYRIIYDGNDEFTPVCEDFNNMAAQLKQSIELTNKQELSRKELLAGISHDLRSPLTSIKAYIEGLLDGVAKTPEAQTNYMRIIKTKAEDIDRMTSKLFLFSQIDLGDYPYYPELLDLTQEITSFVGATEEEYEAKGLRVSIKQIESDIAIYADPVQIRSIFANILENSLKYKDKDETKASIFVQHDGAKVRIVIEDDGPGVPDEALGKLFDVFYRSDPSRSNPNKGSGLGLAIVAKAVSKMSGKIFAENQEQGGLRMVIELPMAAKEEDDEKNIDH